HPLGYLRTHLCRDGSSVQDPGGHGRILPWASRTSPDEDQWRKWRVPVRTTAIPRASAAASTSSSPLEPPGWITAVTPASPATSSASGNGKKASEAITAP